MSDCLKLTVYFGETDRTGHGMTSDALLEAFARAGFRTSVLLRAAEGFGSKHGLHTERMLTLSEDLPLVAVAVDTRERIEAALPSITPLVPAGVVTLENASFTFPRDSQANVKLTLYIGRHARSEGGAPAHIAAIQALHDHGVAGATALLGVDGTADGARRRASFLGRNEDVPCMVIAVGERERIAAARPDLPGSITTIENVTICKRDGVHLDPPHAGADPEQLQKLMVYTRHHPELVRRLRMTGAAGATSLRGFWGYHGEHAPHGERFLSLRRELPAVTVVIDTPERIAELWPVVDEATAERGLVTSELVRPAPR